MGCWNGTCNISNMPIFEGDKVVLIPLMKVHEGAAFNTCYPTDNFIPLGFPIIGYYNDYGGLYDIEISDVNREYFKSLDFYFSGRDEEGSYKKVKEYENFEDFVNEILCSVEGCYVDVTDMDIVQNDLVKDGKTEVNFMMIHYGLYEALMNNMKNRKPYKEDKTFEVLQTEKFIEEFNKEVNSLVKVKSSVVSNDGRVDKAMQMLYELIIRNLSNSIFNKGNSFYEGRWNYFIESMIEDESIREELIKCAVDKYIFMFVLSRMRKGYLCDSGCGSQSAETKLHMIMAEFIQKQAMKNAERYEDIAKIKGVEEPIFF